MSVVGPALEHGPLSRSFLGIFVFLKGWRRLINFFSVIRGEGAPVDF